MREIKEILEEVRPEFDFSESENFIDDGYLDSFDLMTLVASLEAECEISIKGNDIIPENFANIDTIKTMLKKYNVEV